MCRFHQFLKIAMFYMNNLFAILKTRTYLFLLFITIFAAVIRFYDLTKIPVSLYWDEVATGYNAYSIATTARDEYGTFLPILFKSYNDYKMPLNIYLTAVSVTTFGLNEFSVRFPSAFFGTVSVFVAFFLIRQILANKKIRLPVDAISLLTAFLLAISPWHIQFSRAGFEANLSLFFIILGMYLLLKGRQFYKYYLLSLIIFSVALYGYRSAFIFLPFVIIGVHLFWLKEYLKFGKAKIIIALFVFITITIPIILPLVREGSARYQQTNISNKVEQLSLENFSKGKPVNKKILYVTTFLQGYSDEFTPQFLFLTGDPEGRHSARGRGMLYPWEVPFIFLGMWFLFKKTSVKIFSTVTLWILAAPIPAALSIPTPHALRSLNILPMPQLLTSLGVICAILMLPRLMKRPFATILSVVVLIFFANFTKQYSLSNSKLVASNWGDGYKQLVKNIDARKNAYDRIVISGHYWQPYMYFLFYNKFSPAIYQKTGNSEHFDKFLFGGTSWDLAVGRKELSDVDLGKLAKEKKVLVALSPEEYKAQKSVLNIIDKTRDNAGKTVFIIGELK